MKWSWSRFFIILSVLILVAGIVLFVYIVHARRRAEEYKVQVEAIFTLTGSLNENTLVTDPSLSVIASWKGQKWVISPDNYKTLLAYLRRDAAMPLFMRKIDPDQCLTITCCNESVFRVMPESDSGEAILVELTSGGQTFRMRAHGGLIWDELIRYCTVATYPGANLLLEGE